MYFASFFSPEQPSEDIHSTTAAAVRRGLNSISNINNRSSNLAVTLMNWFSYLYAPLGSAGNDVESRDTFYQCSIAVESGIFIWCRLQNLRALGVAPRISASYPCIICINSKINW